jgi:hypothetical protein
VVFFILNVHGRGINWLILYVNNFNNLQATAFCHFTIGRMCWFSLWIFIMPLVVGTVGV